jgi:hypothetical protein
MARTLRREGRRIRQELSSVRQRQGFQSRDLSPGSRLAGGRHEASRSSHPVLNDIDITHAERTIAATVRTTDSGSISEHASSQSRSSLNSMEMRATTGVAREEMFPASSPELKESSVLSLSSNFSVIEPRICGPIIRDNGEEITEIYGEWRVGVSESPPYFTGSNSTVANTVPSLSRSRQGDAKGQRQRPKRRRSTSAGCQKNHATTDPTETDQHPTKAGSSPYKAMPPFVDEDWKGIRCPPST